MTKGYKKEKETLSKIIYNVVFCTRYKRKIFIDDEKINFLINSLEFVAKENDFSIKEINVYPYYIKLNIESTPMISPHMIVSRLKDYSSSEIRGEFQDLKHLPSIWTRHYLATTDKQLDDSIIEDFIKIQKSKG